MSRSLLPREHGAYVQLAAPLAATFISFGATLASTLLAIATCLAFAANEPLLVVLGHRGRRAADDGGRARRVLVTLASAAAITCGVGLVLAPPIVSMFAAIVAVPAGVLVVLAYRRRERSLVGELVAAVVFAGASAPIALAAAGSVRAVVVLWLAWAIGFATTVIAIHRVIARHRRPATVIDVGRGDTGAGRGDGSVAAIRRHRRPATAIDAGVVAVLFAVAVVCVLVTPLRLAAPLVLASTALVIASPTTRHLRTIGVLLVGVSTISIILAVSARPLG